VFKFLAVVPAALCWIWFYIVVSSLPGLRDATLQDWWHVVLSVFLAALFSLPRFAATFRDGFGAACRIAGLGILGSDEDARPNHAME